jgi:hypothetical protein
MAGNNQYQPRNEAYVTTSKAWQVTTTIPSKRASFVSAWFHVA